jgi:hypothetical protein
MHENTLNEKVVAHLACNVGNVTLRQRHDSVERGIPSLAATEPVRLKRRTGALIDGLAGLRKLRSEKE